MRVLHINKRYPPHIGGIERHVQDLAASESQYARGGRRARASGPAGGAEDLVEVEVLCVAEERSGWERDGRVAVYRARSQGLVASNPLSTEVASFLRDSAVRGLHDVWHFHYPFPTGEAALVGFGRLVPSSLPSSAVMSGPSPNETSPNETSPPSEEPPGEASGWSYVDVPGSQAVCPVTVCTYHSDFVAEPGAKRALSLPYAWLTRRFLSAVDAVLVSSPQLAQNSRFLPAVADKVHVIPFGIDAARFTPTEEIRRRVAELREGVEAPVVLFVGRLVPYKGAEFLLRALAHVPGARGVLVGDGPLREQLVALAADLGISARITFREPLSHAELVAQYFAADLFVLPSVSPNEAFGLVQLEAHACGLPVISTDLPTGVPFANKNEETGLIVPPRDADALAGAISRLLSDRELRGRLGRQAQVRVAREFSRETMTRRVLALYQELLARPRTPLL